MDSGMLIVIICVAVVASLILIVAGLAIYRCKNATTDKGMEMEMGQSDADIIKEVGSAGAGHTVWSGRSAVAIHRSR